jgi:hypothetical protein
MDKEKHYEAALKRIAEGSDAVPGEAWRAAACDALAQAGVGSNFAPDKRVPWPGCNPAGRQISN